MRRVLMLGIGYGELGGVGTVTKELTEALHERGDYEVDVLSYWPWHRDNGRAPFSFRRDDGSETTYPSLDAFVNSDDSQYHLIQFHNQIFSDPYLRMMPENTLTLDQFLARYDAPSVMLTHSVALRQAMHERASWSNLQVEAQKQVMQRANHIVHLTQEQRDYVDTVLPEFADKSVVIGNGTRPGLSASAHDLDAFRAQHADNKKIGLYLGRISNEKGIWELLDATAKIKQHDPTFKLLVAGNNDAPTTQKLREHCRKRGLREGEDIAFLGWLEGTEKTLATQAADFVILPSHYEHFPMTVLEAMSVGTPCIISDVPGPRSVFHLRNPDERCALPIDIPGSVDSIATTIQHALEHSHALHHIALRAQRLVNNRYTWDIIAEEYHALFDRAIHAHRRGTAVESVPVTPSVGIVVPTYNRKDRVIGTIDSLLDQDYGGDIKIVVVDDGSIDGTTEHLASHYKQRIDSIEDHILGTRRVVNGTDGTIILVRQTNKHVSNARNTGLRILHQLGCDYFSHQDDGDLALPQKIRTLVDYLDAHPEHDIVHATAKDATSQHDTNYRESTFFKKQWERATDPASFTQQLCSGSVYVHNQTTLWRRKILDTLGLTNLFWEQLKQGDDMDFYMKIARNGFDFGFVNTPVAVVVNEPDPLSITPSIQPHKLARELLDSRRYNNPKPIEALRILNITRKLDTTPHPDITPKDLFSLRFESLFSLTFSRDYAIRTGNLARALLLAEELVKHDPSAENIAAVRELERRIRDLERA